MIAAWWSGDALLFDCESDGVNPTEARIIQWCAARVGGGEIANWTEIVRPERDIDPKAVEVHGISTQRAEAEGKERVVSVAALAARLASAGPTVPVVAHNARYDATLLDREMRRLGIGSLGTDGDLVTVRIDGRQVGAFHVIDSLVLDKAVDPYRKGSRKLVDVAAHYGVPIRGDAHTADADALAAGRIAWAIARRCAEPSATLFERYRDRKDPGAVVAAFYALRLTTLPELHRAQVGWAAEQARGLAAYFRRTGKGNPDGVSQAWPLEPVVVAPAPGIVTVDTGGLL